MAKHSRYSRLVAGPVLAGFLLLPACGGGRGDITGEVTYKGEPVSVGRITFLSQVGKQEVKMADIIRGKFTIKAFPAGPVKITVESFQPPEPEKLQDARMAKLSQAEGMKPFMKAPPPALLEMADGPPLKFVPIPLSYANPETSNLTYEVKRGPQTFDIPLGAD